MFLSRTKTRRLGWAAVVVGLLLSIVPLVTARATAVTGTYPDSKGPGAVIDVIVNGNTESTWAGQFDLVINGSTYKAFCIDYGPFIGGTYNSVPWSASGKASAMPKVKRVIEVYLSGARSAPRAAAAQALIWRFTDGVQLAPTNTPAIVSAYEQMDAAVAGGSGSEPAPEPTVDIGNGTTSGVAGETFGPFVVSTNRPAVQLVSNNPAVIVKVGGVPSNTAGNGAALTIEVPAGTPAGSATISASVAGSAGSGTVMKSPRNAQPLVLIDEVPVTATDSITITWTAGGDAPPVVATPVVDCDAKDVTFSITNPATNTASVTVVVSDPVEGSKTVTLAPGETKTVKVLIGADGVYDITVTHDGKVLTTAKGNDDDCDEPKPPVVATPVVDCAAKAVTIQITNPATNTASVTVVVSDPGAGSQNVVLAPGETTTVSVPIGADGVYDITVTHDGKVLTTAKGNDDDCDKPAVLSATADVQCAAGTVTVTVRNSGGLAGSATVADAAAGFSQAVSVPGSGQVQVTVPIGPDAAYDIVVTGAAGNIARFTDAVVTCPPPPPPPPPPGGPVPQAAVTDPCNTSGVLLSLMNTGTGTVLFTVTSSGAIVASGLAVNAGGSQPLAVPVTPPSYSIRVTAQGYDQTFAGSLAVCNATTTTVQVAGTTVVPSTVAPGGEDPDVDPGATTSPTVLGTTVAPDPSVGGGTLPRTGAASQAASGMGMALLLLGGCLLLISALSRREQHPIRL